MDLKNHSLNIAVFHNLPSGGALRTLYERIEALEKRGYRVSLYSFTTAEEGFLPLPYFSGREVKIPLSFEGPFRAWEYIRASVKCAKEINASDADLVYIDKCRFLGAPPILRFLKKPAVLYLHEPLGIREYLLKAMPQQGSLADLSFEYFRLPLLAKIKKIASIPMRLWIKWQDRCSVLSAALVMTSSRFVKEWIRRVYGIEALVCCYGVNSGFFKPAENVEKKNQVLSVGRLEPRKGHDFLIEVLSKMEAGTRPELVIVCDEADKERRKRLEENARLASVKIDIVNRPPQEVLRTFYQESRLVLCAGICEPFGLSPLEAMACGTPVVAVAEGGYQETVRHGQTGLLLARDSALWAKEIERLLADPERVRKFGMAGREDVEKQWTWKNFINTIDLCFKNRIKRQ